MAEQRWQVLLVGGCSGTGKTILAHQLAQRFKVGLTQADDIRLALQRVTTPQEQPLLHFFTSTANVWQKSPGDLCGHLIDVGRIVSRALEAVLAHHLDTPHRVILEGDGIVPGLAAYSSMQEFKTGLIRALFLVEPDEQVLLENMLMRGRRANQYAVVEQQKQARMNWLYGQWLEAEARRHGLPCIASRPYTTLLARATAAIQ